MSEYDIPDTSQRQVRYDIPDISQSISAASTPGRPFEAWLQLGASSSGAPMFAQGRVLAVGLEPGHAQQLMLGVLGLPEPTMLVSGAADPGIAAHLETMHYDLTASCESSHSHVVWDPAQLPIDQYTYICQDLILGASDAAARFEPSAHVPGDLAAFIPPEMWTVSPVICVALRSAHDGGHGLRAAMDWLAGGQLAQLVAYYRSVSGPEPPPLVTLGEQLVAGPADARDQAVLTAWQALAPIEEITRSCSIRHAAADLDLAAWLGSASTLAVSLPDAAPTGYGQAVAAMLAAANYVRESAIAGDVNRLNRIPIPSIWRGCRKPALWEAWSSKKLADTIRFDRMLVLADDSSQFASWASSRYEWARQSEPAFPLLLLGAHADAQSLQLAAAMARSPVSPSPPGQLILVSPGAQMPLWPAPGSGPALPSG